MLIHNMYTLILLLLTALVRLPPGQYPLACSKRRKIKSRQKKFSYVDAQVVLLERYDSRQVNSSLAQHSDLVRFVYRTKVI